MKREPFTLLLCLVWLLSLGACSVDGDSDTAAVQAYYSETPLVFVGHKTLSWSYDNSGEYGVEEPFKDTNRVNVDTDFKVTIADGQLVIDHSLAELLLGRRTDEKETVMGVVIAGNTIDYQQVAYTLMLRPLNFVDYVVRANGDTVTTDYSYEFSPLSQAVVNNYSGELTISLILRSGSVNGVPMPEKDVVNTGWALTAKRVQ